MIFKRAEELVVAWYYNGYVDTLPTSPEWVGKFTQLQLVGGSNLFVKTKSGLLSVRTPQWIVKTVNGDGCHVVTPEEFFVNYIGVA